MFHAKAQWKKTFSLLMIFLLLLSNVSFMQSVYAEETVSVEEAIENNEGMATVEGHIVGYVISGNNVTTDIDRFENTNIAIATDANRSEEHTSELQSRFDLVCRLLLEKKNNI